MRTRNFRVRSEVVEGGSVTKSQEGRKACVGGEWESVFSGNHRDNARKKTHVVSVMTNKHKETCAVVRDEKGRSSSPAPNSKAKTDDGEEKSATTSGIKEESSSDKRSEIPCR